MEKNEVRKQFGYLPPKYIFSLNPYSNSDSTDVQIAKTRQVNASCRYLSTLNLRI